MFGQCSKQIEWERNNWGNFDPFVPATNHDAEKYKKFGSGFSKNLIFGMKRSNKRVQKAFTR